MDDELLSYYNRELNYIRKSGAEFSEKYPKIAGNLRLDKEVVEDPHVSRLIESFAFLTARIRHSLDDGFPELTEALMGVMYPDYHAPLPSMTILELGLLPHLPKNVLIPRGEQIKLQANDGSFCHYKTCASTEILPVLVDRVGFYNLPAKAPKLPADLQLGGTVKSVVKVKLLPADDAQVFDFKREKLRFYINGPSDVSFKLHQVLLNNTIGIAIAENAQDENPIFLTKDAIKPCGFSLDDGALEYSHSSGDSSSGSLTTESNIYVNESADSSETLEYDKRSSSAHRLLAEYFLLPQKFLFAELGQISSVWEKYSDGFEVYIYTDATDTELVRSVGKNTLKLGCVPIVNLFESTTQAIQASSIGGEVLLRVNEKTAKTADIYRINDVFAINSKGESKLIPPFYGDFSEKLPGQIYWSYRRKKSNWQGGKASYGTDIYIDFVDLNCKTIEPDSEWIIHANVTCTNRDQVNYLPFGPGQPSVQFASGGAGLQLNCLIAPTPTVLPKLDDASRWQLVSQLSLQHFSNKNGLSKLKEMLTLYNFNDSKEVFSLIEGVIGLGSELVSARVLNKGRAAMCQGTHFILTCDENFYTGNSLFLFGSILDDFFSQFSAINTFTQLSIKTTRYSRVEFSWPARVGTCPLV